MAGNNRKRLLQMYLASLGLEQVVNKFFNRTLGAGFDEFLNSQKERNLANKVAVVGSEAAEQAKLDAEIAVINSILTGNDV